jgi:hypothetical protein
MRQSLAAAALIVVVILGGCARNSSDIDSMQPGTPVTVTMKDGSVVSGRLVQAKADAVVVDPSDGGEWRNVSRDQIASISTQQAASGQAPGAAAQAPPSVNDTTAAGAAHRKPTSAGGRRVSGQPPTNAAAPTSQPAVREVTIPAGTVFHARLDTPVASDTSHVEDRVAASLTKSVVIDDEELVPTGTTLTGVVTQATPSGHVKGRAEVAFRFDVLTVPSGDERRVQTRTVGIEAPSTKKKDALKIGVPAAGGAILGGILGGKKGAAIGGAVGGGAGTAVVLTTAGQEVRLPAGSAVTIKLLQPVTVPLPASR